jgi:hypothetical protein
VGQETVNEPAFYARTGSPGRDVVALLHPPYTLWHLSYVAMGAAIAPEVDWVILAGTLLAFFSGLGVAAHALDELHDRPLSTGLSRHTLLRLSWAGLGASAALAVAGAFLISPWLLAWAAVGVLLAVGYPREVPRWLHTDVGFAVAWGAFPVLVGYWAQTQRFSLAVALMAVFAILTSMTQRTLSTPARFLRRQTTGATASFETAEGPEHWSREQLQETWEWPLRLLVWAMVSVALALLARHL